MKRITALLLALVMCFALGYYFNDKPFTTYKGTYKYTAPILTLTYDETDYPLIVKDGVIYFLTFSK